MFDLGKPNFFQDILPNNDDVEVEEKYVVAVRQQDGRLMDIIDDVIEKINPENGSDPLNCKEDPKTQICKFKKTAKCQAKKAALSASGELDSCPKNSEDKNAECEDNLK